MFDEQTPAVAIAQRVSEVAEACGLPMAHVALAWMLSKRVFTVPVVGATKPHHLEDAVAALAVQLTPDEIRQLDETYQPHRCSVMGDFLGPAAPVQ